MRKMLQIWREVTATTDEFSVYQCRFYLHDIQLARDIVDVHLLVVHTVYYFVVTQVFCNCDGGAITVTAEYNP